MNNKAFTLIELLAVIAILAIILLVAVPKVLSTVKNTKLGAFKTNAQMLIRAIDLKEASDPTFDYKLLNTSNLNDMLGIDGSKYESLSITKEDGKTNIFMVGKDSWDELLAAGTIENMFVKSGPSPTPASKPDIASNQIPIYYDELDKSWKKADVNNTNESYKWYDYPTKKWANAVTVTNGTRSTYQSATLGTPILENDILTYMVWIPKYKYKIPVGNKARTIDIVFEGSTTPNSTGDAVATYRTHPAFTFGTTELNGIWLSKYELTGTIGAITTKPGMTSLKDQNISSFFTAIRTIENGGNDYGYVASEVDTHMIKNSEWGAAAYLSHSIYGKLKEISINDSSPPLTGDPGPAASTTGNVYGIYDMNGGTYDFVMGNLGNRSGYNLSYNSGFNGLNGDSSTTVGIPFPEAKYYNVYTSESPTIACDGEICYGAALSETADWYNDYPYFILASNPWLMRGGNYSQSTGAGVFNFLSSGGNSGSVTTRICQTKQ